MSDLVIVAAGVVVFAATTVTTLLFGYLRMAEAYRREESAAAERGRAPDPGRGVSVRA